MLFSLLLPLNYLPLVLQCTKCSISFTLFLNLKKNKILDFLAVSNIHYLELFQVFIERQKTILNKCCHKYFWVSGLLTGVLLLCIRNKTKFSRS